MEQTPNTLRHCLRITLQSSYWNKRQILYDMAYKKPYKALNGTNVKYSTTLPTTLLMERTSNSLRQSLQITLLRS